MFICFFFSNSVVFPTEVSTFLFHRMRHTRFCTIARVELIIINMREYEAAVLKKVLPPSLTHWTKLFHLVAGCEVLYCGFVLSKRIRRAKSKKQTNHSKSVVDTVSCYVVVWVLFCQSMFVVL